MIIHHAQRTAGGRAAGRSDVYTLLLIVAVVVLVLGIGFVLYRTRTLFKTSSPAQPVATRSALTPSLALRS